MTKQGYPRDYIEEVIASDALNEEPEIYDDTGQNHVEQKIDKKDIKTAPDAAKAVNSSDATKKVNDVQNKKHAEELDKDIKAAQVNKFSFTCLHFQHFLATW